MTTLEEFEQACLKDIMDFYNPELDGPLLVAGRTNSVYNNELKDWDTWPEYAAAIGYWPAQHNGRDYAQFMIEPRDCIVDLVRHAKELWQTRQPEPEASEPNPYDSLLN